jgi:hypothetical protein
LQLGQRLQVTVNSRMTRLCKGVGLVWYAGHIFACCFCALGYHELHAEGQDGSWISSNGLEGCSVTDVYLRSYFVMMYTLSTVGYGSMAIATDTERLFTAAVMLCGSLLCDAGVAAIMGSMITVNDTQKNATRIHKESVAKFCLGNDVSAAAVAKSTAYFEHVQSSLHSETESEAFACLSPALRTEYISALTLPLLTTLGVLQCLAPDAQQGYFRSIVRQLQPVMVCPGDKLSPYDLYVLRWGKLQCVHRAQDSQNLNTTSSQTSTSSNMSASQNSRASFAGSRLPLFSPGRRSADSAESAGIAHRGSTHRCSLMDRDVTLVSEGSLICDKTRCFLRPVESEGAGDGVCAATSAAEGEDARRAALGLLPGAAASGGTRGRRRSSLGRRASEGYVPLEVFHEGEEDSSDDNDTSSSDTSSSDGDLEESPLEEEEQEEEGAKDGESTSSSAAGAVPQDGDSIVPDGATAHIDPQVTVCISSVQLPPRMLLAARVGQKGGGQFLCCRVTGDLTVGSKGHSWHRLCSMDEEPAAAAVVAADKSQKGLEELPLCGCGPIAVSVSGDCASVKLALAFVVDGRPTAADEAVVDGSIVTEIGDLEFQLPVGQGSSETVDAALVPPCAQEAKEQASGSHKGWLELLVRFEGAVAARVPRAAADPGPTPAQRSHGPENADKVRSIRQIVGDTIVCVSAESVDVTNISAAHTTQTDAGAAVLDSGSAEEPGLLGRAQSKLSALIGTEGDAVSEISQSPQYPYRFGKVTAVVTVTPGGVWKPDGGGLTSASEESAASTDSSLSSTSPSVCRTEEYCTNSANTDTSDSTCPSRVVQHRGSVAQLQLLLPPSPEEHVAIDYCHLLHIGSLELRQIASYFRDVNKHITSKLE